MAAINTKIVRRSHALLDYPYGKDFRYREAVMTGKGASGWFKANSMTAGLGGFMFAASFDFSRGLLERFVLPEPGEGPDREQTSDHVDRRSRPASLVEGSTQSNGRPSDVRGTTVPERWTEASSG